MLNHPCFSLGQASFSTACYAHQSVASVTRNAFHSQRTHLCSSEAHPAFPSQELSLVDEQVSLGLAVTQFVSSRTRWLELPS